MSKRDSTDERQQLAINAIAYFSVLMHDWAINDIKGAAASQRALEQLGIVVKLLRPRKVVPSAAE
jgi:hypothetical protein